MLFSFKTLVLSTAALCTTAAFAAEQRRVEVPFSFVAKNHAYQAGSYAVTVDWQKTTVTLEQIGQVSQPLTWIIVPGDSAQPKVSLTFDVTGPEHVLRAIQYKSFTTPNLDRKQKTKVEAIESIGE
jgi:hypothetical protein